jgi:hypothetical protein
MPKKHEPKKESEKRKKRYPSFQKFQNKRERGMTLECTKFKNIFHTLAQS